MINVSRIYGGSKGYAFIDYNPGRIVSIEIQHDHICIRGLTIVYRKGEVTCKMEHGGSAEISAVVLLEEDDECIEIVMMKTGEKCLKQLQFKTNKGRVFGPYGVREEGDNEILPINLDFCGQVLLGFAGRCSFDRIDGLGIICSATRRILYRNPLFDQQVSTINTIGNDTIGSLFVGQNPHKIVRMDICYEDWVCGIVIFYADGTAIRHGGCVGATIYPTFVFKYIHSVEVQLTSDGLHIARIMFYTANQTFGRGPIVTDIENKNLLPATRINFPDGKVLTGLMSRGDDKTLYSLGFQSGSIDEIAKYPLIPASVVPRILPMHMRLESARRRRDDAICRLLVGGIFTCGIVCILEAPSVIMQNYNVPTAQKSVEIDLIIEKIVVLKDSSTGLAYHSYHHHPFDPLTPQLKAAGWRYPVVQSDFSA